MKSYIKDMVSKAPAPDEMEGADDAAEEQDEDGDTAAQRSAMQDYIAAIKKGDADAALSGFKELVSYCK
jgi:predicted transcriptional regulator